MYESIEVIVSECCKNPKGEGYIAYNRISSDSFRPNDKMEVPINVIQFACKKIAEKVCVIIRPNFNETDKDGKRFFREWRSFAGQDFQEVRFTIPS